LYTLRNHLLSLTRPDFLNSKAKENKLQDDILAQPAYPHLALDSTARPSRCCQRRRRLTCSMAHERAGGRRASTRQSRGRCGDQRMRRRTAGSGAGRAEQTHSRRNLEKRLAVPAEDLDAGGGRGEPGELASPPAAKERLMKKDEVRLNKNAFSKQAPPPAAHTS
jgi:hypothetical protein